jgi:hypothetical protein
MKFNTLFALFFMVLIGCNNTENKSEVSEDINPEENLTTAQKIAYKNGFENFENVSEINFTFNVDRGENHYERSWIWNPKTDDVTMISKTDTIQYNRKVMDSIIKQTDAGFINDKYWLLAPYNLVWDEGTTFSEKQNVIAPISKDTINQLTVVYGSEGGYTPGDAYDFFYTNDFTIKEWIFRKGNDTIPSMINTWEDYENFNRLEIAKMHKDSTGTFKLYFTNIKVK